MTTLQSPHRYRPRLTYIFLCLILCITAVTTKCITGRYIRWTVSEPINPWRTVRLAPGTDLGHCLHSLGAPMRAAEQGDTTVLYYAWMQDRGWELSLQVLPNAGFLESSLASVSYTRENEKWESVRLIFDRDLKLIRVLRGRGLSPEEFDYQVALERQQREKNE